MPTPKRQKVNYTMTEALLPEISPQHVGEFYVAKAEQSVWFVASNGAVVSLTDLLQNAKPVAPSRHGRDGKDGASIKGERGERGADGKDGTNGKDGVGHAGRDGMHGTNGKDGKDGAPGPDSAAVIAETRAEFALVKQHVAMLHDIVQGLLAANKRGADYVKYLQEKVAGRKK